MEAATAAAVAAAFGRRWKSAHLEMHLNWSYVVRVNWMLTTAKVVRVCQTWNGYGTRCVWDDHTFTTFFRKIYVNYAMARQTHSHPEQPEERNSVDDEKWFFFVFSPFIFSEEFVSWYSRRPHYHIGVDIVYSPYCSLDNIHKQKNENQRHRAYWILLKSVLSVSKKIYGGAAAVRDTPRIQQRLANNIIVQSMVWRARRHGLHVLFERTTHHQQVLARIKSTEEKYK